MASRARKANCSASTRRAGNRGVMPSRGRRISTPRQVMPMAISRLPRPNAPASALDQARETVASEETSKRERKETMPKTTSTTAAISLPQGGRLSRRRPSRSDSTKSSSAACKSYSGVSSGEVSLPRCGRLTGNSPLRTEHLSGRAAAPGAGCRQRAQPGSSIDLGSRAVN